MDIERRKLELLAQKRYLWGHFCAEVRQLRDGGEEYVFHVSSNLHRVQDELKRLNTEWNHTDLFMSTSALLREDYRALKKKENQSRGAMERERCLTEGELNHAKRRLRAAIGEGSTDVKFARPAPPGVAGSKNAGAGHGSAGVGVRAQAPVSAGRSVPGPSRYVQVPMAAGGRTPGPVGSSGGVGREAFSPFGFSPFLGAGSPFGAGMGLFNGEIGFSPRPGPQSPYGVSVNPLSLTPGPDPVPVESAVSTTGEGSVKNEIAKDANEDTKREKKKEEEKIQVD